VTPNVEAPEVETHDADWHYREAERFSEAARATIKAAEAEVRRGGPQTPLLDAHMAAATLLSLGNLHATLAVAGATLDAAFVTTGERRFLDGDARSGYGCGR
jgi:hypothetical protein